MRSVDEIVFGDDGERRRSIDPQDISGHVGGVIGNDVQDGMRDFFRVREPAQRQLRFRVGEFIGREALDRRIAGFDRDDADSFPR